MVPDLDLECPQFGYKDIADRCGKEVHIFLCQGFGSVSAVLDQDTADSTFGLLFGTFALASFLGPLAGAAVGMHAALTILAACALGACLPALFGR